MHQPQSHKSHTYNPNHLLDAVMHRLGLSSDSALSSRLKLASGVIRGIRHGRLPVGASLLLVMQEASGFSIKELRQLMGDRRARIRPGYAIDTNRRRERSLQR